MDWLKQSQDMFRVWVETQEKMMRSWSDATSSKISEPTEIREKSIQTWENSFKNLVETQALWARMWARNFTTGQDSDVSATVVKAVEEMSQNWVQVQQKLWMGWFDMIRQLDPAKMNDEVQGQVSQLLELWQQNMQKIMDTQQEWAKKWADIVPVADDKKAKKDK